MISGVSSTSVGRRRILDQLVERRLLDHLARRDGDVAADLERARLGMGELALLQVAQHMLEAVAAGSRPSSRSPFRAPAGWSRRNWTGSSRRRRRGWRSAACSRVCVVHPLDRVDRAEQPLGDQQIGLADHVEERIVAPFGRGKAPVAVGLLGKREGAASSASRPAVALASARCQMPRPRSRAASAARSASPDRRTGSSPASSARSARRRPAAPPPFRRLAHLLAPYAPSSSAGRGPSPRSSAGDPPGSASGRAASAVRRRVGGVGHGGS